MEPADQLKKPNPPIFYLVNFQKRRPLTFSHTFLFDQVHGNVVHNAASQDLGLECIYHSLANYLLRVVSVISLNSLESVALFPRFI